MRNVPRSRGVQGAVARCSGDRPTYRPLIGRPGAGRLSNGRPAPPPTPPHPPPPPPHLSLPLLQALICSQKNPKKRRGVRRSEAAKPCWILDLRSAGNCLSLIIQYDRYSD